MAKKNKAKIGSFKKPLTHEGNSFIIGNGTSRKGLDLQPLKKHGNIFGCNWFFKEEFAPDVLVASDEPMTHTILKNFPSYPKNNWFVTWYAKPGSGAKKASCPEKFAAGPMATEWACNKLQSTDVFLIGMDFFGYGSDNKNKNGFLNNLYQGKKHYQKDETVVAPTYRNWQRRFEWILKTYPNTQFWHVNPFEGKSPERLRGYPNFHQITYDNLLDHLENDTGLNDVLQKTDTDIELIKQPNEDDLRACLERQLAGQENIVYGDLLTPQQVLDLRLQALAQGGGTPEKPAMCGASILGFEVMIPQLTIQDGHGVRFPTEIEVKTMFQKEINERQRLLVKSGITPSIIDVKSFAQLQQPATPAPPPLMAPPPPPMYKSDDA